MRKPSCTAQGKAYPIREIREDFPILKQLINGYPLVYLDNSATSQRPQVVIDAVSDFYGKYNASIHRAIHTLGEKATAAYEEARQKVADFIGARSSEEIVFTTNATESINLVAHSWGRANIRENDEIIISQMEHHSNIIPWQLLAEERGARLRVINITADGLLDLEQYEKLLSPRVKLVAITMMSNVLGTINPIKEIAERAHGVGAQVLVDGAQGVTQMPVDVQDLNCDFLDFSGHKMCAPTGVGVLYGKAELLEAMPPFLTGGGMIRKVSFEGSSWADVPFKFEAGTPMIAEAIGLGVAIDYLSNIGMDSIRAHEQEVIDYALKQIGKVEGVKIYGPSSAEVKGGVVVFTMDGIHPHDLAEILNRYGIAVRAGHHCAMPLHDYLGIQASTRASFYLYNTKEEADFLVNTLYKAKELFG